MLESATRSPGLPSYAALRAGYRASEALLLDRSGEPLQALRLDFEVQRLQWTPLSEVAPVLVTALLRSEDRRFGAHAGVDLLAVAAALRDGLRGRARRGASTLEMQLAAQLDARLGAARGRRGPLAKLRQMRAAWALHPAWTKDQVLEAYLNLVWFRGEAQGIGAAASRLFGKRPAALTPDEAAVLVALLPSPGASAERVAQRACASAGRSGDACAALRQLSQDALERPVPTTLPALAPHLARRLLRTPGERRVSTLDADVQRLALDALGEQLRQLQGEWVRDAAAVVVDNASGEVLAYVGSAGTASQASEVDGVAALRQAGSTLKPFLYALAVEHRWLTAASLLDDAPIALAAANGLYQPQNYAADFKGRVSARSALASSLNIPAVRVLMLAGVEAFRERLHALGYVQGLTEPGEYYGYSLALGSVEVSLLEQVAAYRALAQGGRWSAPRLTPDATPAPARQVMIPEAAYIVADILADRGARALSFDLDGPLSTPYWSAVKTGTSKNLRDNWCIGFTPLHTVGVWVGNFEGDPMRTVSGIAGAAPAWREIMDGLVARGGAQPQPAPPSGLRRQAVRYAQGQEAPREEWFVAGTETARLSEPPALGQRARIEAPADGSLIALDPDIPFDRQHLLLQVRPADARLSLELDGRGLGPAGAARLWPPTVGEHRLRLLDGAGRVLDEARFEVRAPAA